MPKVTTPRPRRPSTRAKPRGGAPAAAAPPLQTRVNVSDGTFVLGAYPSVSRLEPTPSFTITTGLSSLDLASDAPQPQTHTSGCLTPTPSVIITNDLASLRLSGATPDVDVSVNCKLTPVSPYCTECYTYPMPTRGAPTPSDVDRIHCPPHVRFVPPGGHHNVLGPGVCVADILARGSQCLDDPHARVLCGFTGSISYILHVNGQDLDLLSARIIPGNCEHNPISRTDLAWWIARACAEQVEGDVKDLDLVEFRATEGLVWKAVVMRRTM